MPHDKKTALDRKIIWNRISIASVVGRSTPKKYYYLGAVCHLCVIHSDLIPSLVLLWVYYLLFHHPPFSLHWCSDNKNTWIIENYPRFSVKWQTHSSSEVCFTGSSKLRHRDKCHSILFLLFPAILKWLYSLNKMLYFWWQCTDCSETYQWPTIKFQMNPFILSLNIRSRWTK